MSLRLLTAGESHGPELVVVLDGMPAGVPIDQEEVDHHLRRRQQGYGRGARSTKVERDHAEIVSGVFQGRTTGAPIAIRIANQDYLNQPAAPRPPITVPRPGHADLAGAVKYGAQDLRQIRERASARETAGRVAAGALAGALLSEFSIEVGSFVTSVGMITTGWDLAHLSGEELRALAAAAERDQMRCPDQSAAQLMVEAVDRARLGRETLGGTFVVFATDLPLGLGSHTQWDLRLDGRLAGAMLSVPAVKGVEVGPAFEVARMQGSLAQDPIASVKGSAQRKSNFAGGVEGGMTDGQPLVIRCAMKPLSSVRAPLASVDLATGAGSEPPYIRSDICAVPAAAVVGEAMVRVVLASALLDRFGGDRLDLMLAAASGLGPAGGDVS